MFKIYANDDLLYSDEYQDDQLYIISPSGALEIGKSGTIDFTILPSHYLYNSLEKLRTNIWVYMYDTLIFKGRILNWDIDFYKQKTVHCEGNLSFLLDSVQPPRAVDMTPAAFLAAVISEHNLQVEEDKKFTLGTISVPKSDISKRFVNSGFRDTRSTIDTDLIDEYGGFLIPRYVSGGTTYLDYVMEYDEPSTQTLEFASNILDMSENLSGADIFTVLLPTGPVDTTTGMALTIESVNNGSKLIENTDAIAKYGRIVLTENFSEMKTPAELKAKAEEYISKVYKDSPITLNIKALDLRHMDTSIDQFKVGLKFRVLSTPHDIDITLTCTAISYDFVNIENTNLTLTTYDSAPSYELTSASTVTSTIAETNKKGGAISQAYKAITEGDDWLKIEVKKLEIKTDDFIVETNTFMVDATKEIGLRILKGDAGEIVSAINLNEEGVKIFGNKIELNGVNGAMMSVGGHYDKTLGYILGDTYSRLGIEEDGSLLFELINDKNVKAMINASEEGVKIFGKNIELNGVNGAMMSVGGHYDKTLGYILGDTYSRLGIEEDGSLLFELINDKNVKAMINASEEGVKIFGKNIELNGVNGAMMSVGGHYDKTLGYILGDTYSKLGLDENGNLVFNLVRDNNIVSSINASEEGVKIYGKNIETVGVNGLKFTAGGYVDADGNTILGDAYSQINQNKTDITLKVSKNGVVNSINVSQEGVKIKAVQVQITGTDGIIAHGSLAVGDLSATNAAFNNLVSGTTKADILSADYMYSWGAIRAVGNIIGEQNIKAATITLGNSDLAGLLAGKAPISASGHIAATSITLTGTLGANYVYSFGAMKAEGNIATDGNLKAATITLGTADLAGLLTDKAASTHTHAYAPITAAGHIAATSITLTGTLGANYVYSFGAMKAEGNIATDGNLKAATITLGTADLAGLLAGKAPMDGNGKISGTSLHLSADISCYKIDMTTLKTTGIESTGKIKAPTLEITTNASDSISCWGIDAGDIKCYSIQIGTTAITKDEQWTMTGFNPTVTTAWVNGVSVVTGITFSKNYTKFQYLKCGAKEFQTGS